MLARKSWILLLMNAIIKSFMQFFKKALLLLIFALSASLTVYIVNIVKVLKNIWLIRSSISLINENNEKSKQLTS